ncbi:putative transcriptional regulator [Saccharolobus solfataricus]|uniref:Putative transcriptional regulator n=1 Tax=Saccharolobus solfataricus TaxID=2287 RepID=A0A157T1K3_SACSO|nr:putative transcriptional regulator [Saccharolobus solfataricus]
MIIFHYNISLISRYTERYNYILFLINYKIIFLSYYIYSIICAWDTLSSTGLISVNHFSLHGISSLGGRE